MATVLTLDGMRGAKGRKERSWQGRVERLGRGGWVASKKCPGTNRPVQKKFSSFAEALAWVSKCAR